MQPQTFSPDTKAFLAQFDDDIARAISVAPDSGLQQVSEGYREARKKMDEPTVRAMMIEAAAPAGPPNGEAENASSRPKSDREEALERMLDFASLPDARALIEDELKRERAVRELEVLAAAADAMGDEQLSDQFGQLLAQALGIPEAGEAPAELPVDYADNEPFDLDDTERQWLEEMDSQAKAAALPDLADDDEAPESDTLAEGSPAAIAVEAASRSAAMSPANDRPEPTEAQREAGNYAKGHLRLHGMDISIETPKGSRRRPEWPELTAAYGYIRGSKGKDSEQIDVFVGPSPDSQVAFVIDQVSPESGRFDEHKVILGVESEAAARELYLSNYTPGWQGLGAITPMGIKELREWLKTEPQKPRGKIPKPDLRGLADRLKVAWENPALQPSQGT
ncbi:MAG: hypothetical protein Q8L99_04615 [Polycyclovorans sp.]|nr:hypothetical protein [Polycyclovorans sp.]